MQGLLNISDVLSHRRAEHVESVDSVESIDSVESARSSLINLHAHDKLFGVPRESAESVKSAEVCAAAESIGTMERDTYRVLLIATHNLLVMADNPAGVTDRALFGLAADLHDHLVSVVGRAKHGA